MLQRFERGPRTDPRTPKFPGVKRNLWSYPGVSRLDVPCHYPGTRVSHSTTPLFDGYHLYGFIPGSVGPPLN